MEYIKYKTDGWGLSELAMRKIREVIDGIDKTTIKVVEFGSGKSTEFLIDLDVEHKKDILITSFDNDPNYAYKTKEGDGVDLHIRPLVECNDSEFELMFNENSGGGCAQGPAGQVGLNQGDPLAVHPANSGITPCKAGPGDA